MPYSLGVVGVGKGKGKGVRCWVPRHGHAVLFGPHAEARRRAPATGSKACTTGHPQSGATSRARARACVCVCGGSLR